MEQCFICPITHNVMINPYIDNEGNTYEYDAICKWLKNNKSSPITRNYLDLSHLKPNRSLKDAIDAKTTKIDYTYEKNIISSIIGEKTTINDYNYFKLNIKTVEGGNSYPPVDIVAVIDISGSMDSPALVEQDGKSVDIGYTILDITKHALITIIESMKPDDRISVVVFSNDARVLVPLTTSDNINKTLITNLRTEGATNIWAGLNIGLQQFTNTNRIQSLLFLTDGLPSVHLLPPQGILHCLKRKMINSKINIYTFGFGYSLDSDLLINIAKISNGHFSFIPDSGFVGTIFIHALAHINTIAINNLKCYYNTDNIKCIGDNADLTTVHYGQSRTLIFKTKEDNITIKIVYDDKELSINTFNEVQTSNDLLYNIMRLELVETLEQKSKQAIDTYMFKYSHIDNQLMKDFKNQICLAIQEQYFSKWGKNYINSFKDAHSQERCNNFKDQSIQQYGGKLFQNMKDKIDDIYTNMPPPKPSNNVNEIKVSKQEFKTMFNNVEGGCFHPSSQVLMAGNHFKSIYNIVKGDKILDSKGNITSVLCLIKINCKNNQCSMVNIDDLIITPYHPIKINNKWIFPKDINYPTEYKCNNVYNLVLDNNHTIIINNYISCTLGHNITENEVITHEYFGTEKVINDLNKIEGFDKGYIVLNMDNFIRDHTTGKIIKICT